MTICTNGSLLLLGMKLAFFCLVKTSFHFLVLTHLCSRAHCFLQRSVHAHMVAQCLKRAFQPCEECYEIFFLKNLAWNIISVSCYWYKKFSGQKATIFWFFHSFALGSKISHFGSITRHCCCDMRTVRAIIMLNKVVRPDVGVSLALRETHRMPNEIYGIWLISISNWHADQAQRPGQLIESPGPCYKSLLPRISMK